MMASGRVTFRKRPRRFRLHSIEPLEPRLLLHAEGIAFGDSPYLSLSFAPDGTDVDGRPNRIFGYMNQFGAPEVWQQTVRDAFQTWASQTNGDISRADDSGLPFGSPGNTLGDPRFGDVRVGAIPMRPNVYAMAVSRGMVSGTWAGDLLFNSNRPLATLDELFRVSLHEAGHVFGLADNSDPTSVMHGVGIPVVNQPSATDLDQLWAQFGQRSPDQYEWDRPNDSIDRATRIRYSQNSDGYLGESPLIIHADVGSDDRDVYRFDSFEGVNPTGDVTLTVRTSGISQLQPQLTVQLGSGQVIASQSMSSPLDGSVSLTLSDVPNGQRYYLVVDAASTSLSAIGGYSLIVTFDDYLQSSPTAIELYSGPQFRHFSQDDIRDIFKGDPEGIIPLLRDDLHTNDTLATATVLESPPGFALGAKYEAIGSIADDSDLDYYQIRSADFPTGTPNVMTIMAESIEPTGFVTTLQVSDAAGNPLAQRPLLNHNGRTIVQLEDVPNDTPLFLRVAAVPGAPKTGSYRLTVVSGTKATSIATLFAGELLPNEQVVTYSYFVQRPQLTMFALAGSMMNAMDDLVQVTLAGIDGTPFASTSGAADQFMSMDSHMLRPGMYRMRVERLTPGTAAVSFELHAAVITDPLAVPRIDVLPVPILVVAGFDDVFVFPTIGNRHGGNSGDEGRGIDLLEPRPSEPAADDVRCSTIRDQVVVAAFPYVQHCISLPVVDGSATRLGLIHQDVLGTQIADFADILGGS